MISDLMANIGHVVYPYYTINIQINGSIQRQGGCDHVCKRFQMLMANIGHIVYPSCTVNIQMAVFKDREALIMFVKDFRC